MRILFLFCFFLTALMADINIVWSQESTAADPHPQVTNIYRITPREGNWHVDLSNDWKLGWRDASTKDLSDIDSVNDWIDVKEPVTVPIALYKAGKLPHPYVNKAIQLHKPNEHKVWYYKKTFTISRPEKSGYAFLSFDGVDHYCRVWLNGKPIGRHEGMFGGPEFEVSSLLRDDKPNELVVTVASANYGYSETFPSRNPGRIIKPWATSGGSGVENFFTYGMWRGVRLDFVEKTHLERPFIRTESLADDHKEAVLLLETEVFCNKHSLEYTLHRWDNHQLVDFSQPISSGVGSNRKHELKIRLVHGDGKIEESFPIHLREGRNWLKKRLTIKNPALWWPNGLGDPNLYQCELELYEDGRRIDAISMNIGIRTITWTESAGERLHDRWGDWQCVVNGQPIFVKGVNWMPADAYLDIPRHRYHWRLSLAKEAGVQMIRVWGPGLQEAEDFYDYCDEFGIMVWQDFPMGNFDTPDWPQDIWEEMVVKSILRMRNRASLAVWCGGNEFNPYSRGNAASSAIIERNVRIFDNSRKLLRTSPDEGAYHAYPDMCPSWYKKRFAAYPYVAESGIHSMASSHWLAEYINPEELPTAYKMWEKDFKDTHPEVVLHFAEYSPGRVPRMLSRASHIIDMTSPGIEDLTLATQLGAEEFYQVMSEGVQANYPVTTGLMPWVFARLWPVISAIQWVDGAGQPVVPYYTMKRTYEPCHVMLDIDRILWKSGETFPIRCKVLQAANQKGFAGRIRARVLNDVYQPLYDATKPLQISDGVSIDTADFEPFRIAGDYKSRIFYIVTELFTADGRLVSRSTYRPRTIAMMEENEFYKKYTTEPIAWPTLQNGPWFKNTVEASPKTRLEVSRNEPRQINPRDFEQTLTIKNAGSFPCPLVMLDVIDPEVVVACSDNFFWLEPGETRTIKAVVHTRDGKETKPADIRVRSWNAQ